MLVRGKTVAFALALLTCIGTCAQAQTGSSAGTTRPAAGSANTHVQEHATGAVRSEAAKARVGSVGGASVEVQKPAGPASERQAGAVQGAGAAK